MQATDPDPISAAPPQAAPAAPAATAFPASGQTYGIPVNRSLSQWQSHIGYRLRTGQPVQAVLAELAASGCPQPQAYAMVRAASAEIQKGHMKTMLISGGIALGALAITLFTYQLASNEGGTYFIFWGPVLFGGFAFFRAFWAWWNTPRV